MGLEISRKKGGTLRLKYWYGRFEENYPAVKFVSQGTRIMAHDWLASLEAQKISTRTYNDKMYVLKGFFERVGSEAGVVRNPFAGCKKRNPGSWHRLKEPES